ncbi:MAG: PorT family protein [Winogradskyella sp.]|nr:PorT family protein [Winogradskyella sp.]
MKQIFILLSLLVCSALSAQSTEFGVKGGLNFTFYKVTQGDFGTNPDIETGYYGGIFLDFKIDNGFHIQPELLYKGIGDFRFINAPIYLKYDIYNAVHILVGPSLNYFFDFFVNKFKVRADLSLEYDLSFALSTHMKYTIGFQELAPNVLFFGIGYRL